MKAASNTHFVILAGGSGQRLWPLSTKNCPKHLIPFIGQKSLLQQTIDRISPMSTSYRNIWIITNEAQLNSIKNHVDANINIISEPAAQNTAPAILFICQKIKTMNNDSTIIILPADHFIPDQSEFLQDLSKICNFVEQHNKIATIGIKPTFPSTGYGYIQVGNKIDENMYSVQKFHEKPNIEMAHKYIAQTNMFWNGGIFIGKLNTFIKEFESHAPKLYTEMNQFFKGQFDYKNLENISIDYAIMEKSQNIVAYPANFEWSDVGNLSTFLTLQQEYQFLNQEIINVDGQNNLASTNKKVVVFVGLSDLCVVETNDVILISKKDAVENVKKALPKISKTHQNTL